MRNSSYDGRSRRTLQEAFGPHTSSHISTQPQSYPRSWWFAMGIIAVATLILVVVTA